MVKRRSPGNQEGVGSIPAELDEAIDTDELENILDVDVLRDEEDGGEEGDEGERDEEENMKEEEEEEDKMKKMKEKK
ncbi:hypothetical protein M8J77_012667 [Diaphorina citri]|nr:hypothetical protein M8J77_012667 [Diaphorina citri]